MNKLSFNQVKVFFLVIFLAVSFIAEAAVTLRYTNKDTKEHVFSVKIGGSTSTVKFAKSGTGTITIQGGSNEAEIKTDCGWKKVSGDDTITIKDGCITIN